MTEQPPLGKPITKKDLLTWQILFFIAVAMLFVVLLLTWNMIQNNTNDFKDYKTGQMKNYDVDYNSTGKTNEQLDSIIESQRSAVAAEINLENYFCLNQPLRGELAWSYHETKMENSKIISDITCVLKDDTRRTYIITYDPFEKLQTITEKQGPQEP